MMSQIWFNGQRIGGRHGWGDGAGVVITDVLGWDEPDGSARGVSRRRGDADRLAEAWSNLKRAFVEAVSPALLPIVETIERWLTPGR